MEIREGSRSRNNKLIFITAAVIFLLTVLSLQTQPNGTVVKVSVGDSSFQVANLLNREGVAFSPLPSEVGDGLAVDYTPLTSWARLNKKNAGSHYEILFADGKVVNIIWRDRQGKELGSRLYIKVVVQP